MTATLIQDALFVPMAVCAVCGGRAFGQGRPSQLLWLAAMGLSVAVFLLVSFALIILAAGLLGLLVGSPLLAAATLWLYVAWLAFDEWRRRRRRCPGRLHGWVVQVLGGRLRLMPTPA